MTKNPWNTMKLFVFFLPTFQVLATMNRKADDSKVIWTNYDETSEATHILWMHADPEVTRNKTDSSGNFNVTVLLLANTSYAEFYALTGDYQRNALFFTDYISDYLGIRDLTTNHTEIKLHGMARGIENMAYDWISGNLYWTDSIFNWIMAANRDFRFYTPVFRTGEAKPAAITIHTGLRKLYFSLFMHSNSTIIVSDLAGRNAKVLIGSPLITDITGLTIDYRESRLYFTNFDGLGSTLLSSNLDGYDVVQYADKRGSFFWNVASYRNFLYVTDLLTRGGESGSSDKIFTVWFVEKNDKSEHQYKIKGRPRGITVLSRSTDADENITVIGNQECNSNLLPACEHICLPRVGSRRECQCSLGYVKKGDTKCETNTFDDEFLLVADAGQGKIFQVPFNYNEMQPSTYGIMDVADSRVSEYRITTVAVDTRTEEVFWSDRTLKQIRKSPIDGSVLTTLSNSTHASYMLVDPCTRNIFYVDSDTQSIKVMDSTGSYSKTLKQISPSTDASTSIQMLTLDLAKKKIYWTVTRNQRGKGQVWRMNLDGSNQELVFDLLDWPLAITIDNKYRRLFIGEAKTALIYMQPMWKLEKITNMSHLHIEKQFDVLAYLHSHRPYVRDIKVYEDKLYLNDGGTSIKWFNLTTGPESLSDVGPAEFFVVKSMAVYSSSYDLSSYNCSGTPCTVSHTCAEHICVSANSSEIKEANRAESSSLVKRCLCGDGYVLSGGYCVETKRLNTPPSYGLTCPDDMTFYLPICANRVVATWPEPIWKDDFTPDYLLKITKPNLEALTRGHHVIRYEAQDEHNVVSTCRFTVTVKGVECPPVHLPTYLKSSPLLCGHKFGSEFTISCNSITDKMLYMGKEVDNITNTCEKNKRWEPVMHYTSITCVPMHSTATFTSKESFKSISKTATIGVTSKITTLTNKHFLNIQNKSLDQEKDSNGTPNSISYSTSAVLGGVLAGIILILAILFFAFLMFRRKGSLCLIKINFPKLWKRKPDSVNLNENIACSNHFQIM